MLYGSVAGRTAAPPSRISSSSNQRSRREAGDVVVFDPRQAPGFEVLGGADVTLLDVLAHACSNECFTSTATSSLAIVRGGLQLSPGRYLAANNGGHNHHSARVGVWVEVRGTRRVTEAGRR